MKNITRAGLLFAALTVAGLAFAAPSFQFSTDAKMNLMAAGSRIDVSPFSAMKLYSHNVRASSATLVYTGKDAAGAYAFYDKALKSEGWKDSPDAVMKEDAMMKDGAMKDGTMKDGAMKDSTMKDGAMKGDAMKDDAMKGDAMMGAGPITDADRKMAESMKMKDNSYHGFYSMNKNIISLTTKTMSGKVTVILTIK